MAPEIEARELTRQGIVRARAFLDEVRGNPAGPLAPPPELLQGSLTRRCKARIIVQRPVKPFGTRREVAEYLAPRLQPHRTWIGDRTPFWSWLGIFHFEDTVRLKDGVAKMSPLDETFVVASRRDDSQNYRGIHRHYLRMSWLLHDVHGERAAYLLDKSPNERGYLTDKVFQSQRIFNSIGIMPLVLCLYTRLGRPSTLKAGHRKEDRVGALPHLLRVLNQLERTYDVYGMEPEAVIRILPPEFAPWIEVGDSPIGSATSKSDPPPQETHPPANDPDPPAPPTPEPDPRLDEWERTFRRNGEGRLRYQGCVANLVVEAATDAIEGPVTNADGVRIGRVHAHNAEQAVAQIKMLVLAQRP